MTLIEFLVVTVIVGILAVSVVAKIKTSLNKSRKASLVSYMAEEVRPGMTQYYVDEGKYPSSGLGGLGLGVTDPTVTLKAGDYVTRTITEKTVDIDVTVVWVYASGTPTLGSNSYWFAWCLMGASADGIDLPCYKMTDSMLEESLNLLPPP